MAEAFAATLLYALLNRFAGGGRIWKKLGRQHGGPLPGRAIWYASVLAFLVLWPLVGPVASGATAISFLTWRTLGWYDAIDAGTNDGTALGDFSVMSARGLMLFPAFVFAALLASAVAGVLMQVGLLVAASIGIGACYHAAWHWKPVQRFGKDAVARAEYMAGALIGSVFATLPL